MFKKIPFQKKYKIEKKNKTFIDNKKTNKFFF